MFSYPLPFLPILPLFIRAPAICPNDKHAYQAQYGHNACKIQMPGTPTRIMNGSVDRFHIKIDPGTDPPEHEDEYAESMQYGCRCTKTQWYRIVPFVIANPPPYRAQQTSGIQHHLCEEQGRNPPYEDIQISLGKHQDCPKEQYTGSQYHKKSINTLF
jgi:hypothetical protein